MSNRVEELESKVAELQAAVNGLTEELVETKERLRQLEADADEDYPVTGAPTARTAAEGGDEDEDEGAKADEGEEETTEAESESDGSDIIIA